MIRHLSFVLCLLTSLAAATEQTTVANDKNVTDSQNKSSERPYSPAETLLWFTDHLANIKEPLSLRYGFLKTSKEETGFTDSIEITIDKLHQDGLKSVKVNFFTGERHQHVQPMEKINGNPVVTVYLNGDLYEMKRLTNGGSWNYFQKLIKEALSSAQTEPVMIELEGKQVAGQRIKLTPYANDPTRKRYDKYADKVYEMTFSDAVPGSLYQIHTYVPDSTNKDAPPIMEETLTFIGTKKP